MPLREVQSPSGALRGANEALGNLEGVQFVDPIPDGDASTATVFLVDDRLPPLSRWDEQFRRIVNDSYVLRGVEVSLRGTVDMRREEFFLEGDGRRPTVHLAPLNPADKVQRDRAARAPQAALPAEAAAYATLATEVGSGPVRPVTVTGPLSQTDAGYTVEVRTVRR